ncbi:Ankyrin repeat and BTB/POZ domain-containing protein 1 [Friedmanniomyces endolithicus]|nr:Ankyrin repeat and BTB/POZ domain-containing protein 1 [Friedmanniomyces endolithicus]
MPDDDQPPAKRLKLSYLGTFTILAGAGETPFEVHKDTMCQQSDFFVASCSQAWTEGRKGIVKLPTVEPNTVKLYIHWAYTGNISLDLLDDDPSASSKRWQTEQIVRLYIAADMFLDRFMKNKAMDTLLQRMDDGTYYLSRVPVSFVWENTITDSPLRANILHWWAATIERDYFIKAAKSLPTTFVIELATLQHDLRGRTGAAYRPRYKNRSQYHDHGGKDVRCSKWCSIRGPQEEG